MRLLNLMVFGLVFSTLVSPAFANGIQGHMSSLDPILQKRVQELLLQHGFDPGPVDGDFGRRSFQALMAYMRANNLLEEAAVESEIADVLTPKLARALLGIDIVAGPNGIELDSNEQMVVLEKLGLSPTEDYWSDETQGVFPEQ
jgi:hypothetical protein